VESTGYAPYGKGETLNATVEPRFGYRGEIQIGNRVHLRARDLNTVTARFDRKDPLAGIPGETVETNQYHYANNDPVGFEDPTGLQPTDQTFALPKRKAIHVLGVKEVCDGFFGTIGCIAGDVAGGVKDAVTGPVKLVYRGGIAVWETPGAVYDCVKQDGYASCGGAAAKGFGTGIYDATVGTAAQLGRDTVNNPHKALRNAVTIAVTVKVVKLAKARANAVGGASVAPVTPRLLASSIIDDVIAETRAGSGNLTSKFTLTADQALSAGEKWVGPGYTEIGKPGSGVFRSADGARQFRIDNGSITGAHNPGVPHVHLETISPGSKVPIANNHIPFTK
jgi:RHS repeat-associated protein